MTSIFGLHFELRYNHDLVKKNAISPKLAIERGWTELLWICTYKLVNNEIDVNCLLSNKFCLAISTSISCFSSSHRGSDVAGFSKVKRSDKPFSFGQYFFCSYHIGYIELTNWRNFRNTYSKHLIRRNIFSTSASK